MVRKETVSNSLLTIGEYLLLNLTLSFFYQSFYIGNKFIDNIVLSFISLVILCFCIYKTKSNLDGQWNDFKKNYKVYIRKALKYWLIGFVAMFVSNFLIVNFIFGDIAPNEASNRKVLELYPLYSILNICILGPVTEELLFRLNFKNVFKKRSTFVIITSLIFAGMHMLSSSNLVELIYSIPYFFLGLGLGLAYYDTDNVYSSSFIHILHNSLAVIIILLEI